jgi:hypothetical protein
MRTDIKFSEVRRLLLELGFREFTGPKRERVFELKTADALFVFQAYRPNDYVREYNLLEIRKMLDARGLMSAEAFEDQFRKTPA